VPHAGDLPLFFGSLGRVFFFAVTMILTLVGVFINWEAYHFITRVLEKNLY